MIAISDLGQFMTKHRDRAALIGLLLGLVIFIGVGLSMQKKGGKDISKDIAPEAIPAKVELAVSNTEAGTSGNRKQNQQNTSTGTAAFFLSPSPVELLEQLKSMENLNENVANAKFSGLRMLWPVYFFSLEQTDGDTTTLLADVSEDGFGVMLRSELKVTEFPQLEGITPGEKIWIGGELLAISKEGTGVVFMKTEHITVGEKPVSVVKSSETVTQ